MQHSANTNLDDQQKNGMLLDPGLDYFCFRCDRFAEHSLQIAFPLHRPLPPPAHTHLHNLALSDCSIHTSAPSHHPFLMEIDSAEYPFSLSLHYK